MNNTHDNGIYKVLVTAFKIIVIVKCATKKQTKPTKTTKQYNERQNSHYSQDIQLTQGNDIA